jgi:alkaline phosphatase D
MAANPTRRTLIVGSAAAVGLAGLGGGGLLTWGRDDHPSRSRALPVDPFTLGIASGEPSADGFVLWTRLALEPVAADGLGGMPNRPVDVEWQIAADDRFRTVLRSGTASATQEFGHSVHVEVGGLEPSAEYWYRFRAAGYVSPVGRALTAPREDAAGGTLQLAAVSCANWEIGWFTAYRRVAEDHPQLVVHLGDYIYEGAGVANNGHPRTHAGPEPTTLAGYRQRYGQYHTDPDLQAAHAVAPWICIPDDHEVENDYAGVVPEESSQTTRAAFPARRAAAYRAMWENQPLRRAAFPHGPDAQNFRRLAWGRLATFHLLDTRQYRDDQACGDGFQPDCQERLAPSRSLPGLPQERWLIDGVRQSRATWDVIGQQVVFAQRDDDAGPRKLLSMDAWDGYVAARDRVTAGLLQAGAERRSVNPLVLTGDVHQHYANELRTDYDDPASRTFGVELVTTSVSSSGDGRDDTALSRVERRANPHIKFVNSQRGYVRVALGPDEARAEFRVLPYVTRPGAPASTRASFRIPVGEPGLHPA